ncbi:MAG TPA: RcnB family protein [Thermohalobaculum sp.]|nr:RcnB family protein [Thermohalobaculum sp.]
MAHRHAFAALLAGLLGAAVIAPGSAPAADLVIEGRIGDVFVGIDTRDGWRRDGWHRDHRGHRRGHRGFDPFDPRVDEREFHERLERRFEFEKLFNGGTGTFPEDRRRRALEGWPPPRETRRDRRHGRIFNGVLLPKGHYYHHDKDYYDRYEDDLYAPELDGAVGGRAGLGEGSAAAAEPETPDIRGPRIETARRPDSVPAPGQRLPQGRPHVALDWEDYDLPEPPPGQTYVRFDGAVLLIESATRVVREVVWPPAG